LLAEAWAPPVTERDLAEGYSGANKVLPKPGVAVTRQPGKAMTQQVPRTNPEAKASAHNA
jgi:hypothetical protein